GTTPDAIDLAEDRDRFVQLLHELQLRQPENGIAGTIGQCHVVTASLGFPLVVRPSYVLGGRAMAVVHDQNGFDAYISDTLPALVPADIIARLPGDKTGQINAVLATNPLLFDRYLIDAIEVDVDAICDGKDVFVCAIMEHIEEAGVHSGDSACTLPPHSLAAPILARMEQQTLQLALALGVVGLMNVQFAIKGDDIYILEVNPRASRTVPFVAKVIGLPVAKLAARVMAGETLEALKPRQPVFDHIGVKEAVFPFARFAGVDTVLGPEMRSTGEVLGLGLDFATAFAKSQLGAGAILPTGGTVFVSVRDTDKPRILEPVRRLAGLGFSIMATAGTGRFLAGQGIAFIPVNKVQEGRPHIVGAMKNGEVQLVFNTTDGARAMIDSKSLRRAALTHKIPYYTTLAGSVAAAKGIEACSSGPLEVRSLQHYLGARGNSPQSTDKTLTS
ncbi:MAG: ATP-grasp domain-containing protein, partial [Hyphomicrobiales bacterium]